MLARHPFRRPLVALLTVAALGVLPVVADPAAPVAGALPSGFTDTQVWGPGNGLQNPVKVVFAPDGRVFVAERNGTIREFDNPNDATPKVFADLRPQTYNVGDKGLLGLTVDPQFPTRPYLYALYGVDALPGGSPPQWNDACPTPPGLYEDGCVTGARLSRLTWSPAGQVGAEQILIDGWCHQGATHSIGTVTFGPDGALYVGSGEGAAAAFVDWGQRGTPPNPCGDPPGGAGNALSLPTSEGGAFRAQDLRTPGDPVTLDGAILRVDPDTGEGLPGSPFAGSADANARRIIAYGARNPFRFTFRPGSDEIYIGDVGSGLWEEINRVADANDAVAENFGWPCYEGSVRQPTWQTTSSDVCEDLFADEPGAVTSPRLAWPHQGTVSPDDTCPSGAGAVTGVAFYPGGAYPTLYNGALFFADYTRECIYLMRRGGDGRPDPTTRQLFGASAAGVVDLQAGPGGDLWYVALGDCRCVRRISYTAGNAAPIAAPRATPSGGPVPLAVSFDGSQSYDPESQALTYAWDLDGDGQYDDATGAAASRTYSVPGPVAVGLRVTDPLGKSGSASITVTPGDSPPQVQIDSPRTGLTFEVGEEIQLAGSATDPETGPIPSGQLEWTVVLFHCSPTAPTLCHEHQLYEIPGATGSFTAPDHEYPAHLEVRLTATDTGGRSTTLSRRIDPDTVDLSVATSPAGGSVAVNGTNRATPATITAIKGSTLTLAAPYSQQIGGATKAFWGWSDLQPATHQVAATAGASYVAYYGDKPLLTPPIVRIPEGTGGTTTVTVPVSVSAPTNASTGAYWYTYALTAKAPGDYTTASGALLFGPNETQRSFTLTIQADAIDEPDEIVLLPFSNPLGVAIGGYFGLGAVIIEDDDGPPTLQPGSASIAEGNAGAKVLDVPVTLSGPSGYAVSAGWITTPLTATAGADYLVGAGTLVIPPGETSGKVSLTILGDTVREPSEAVGVVFGNVSGATLPPNALGVGQILDDD